MDYKKHECLNCGTDLSGRADKKFCSDLCRNEYHNHNHTERRKARRAIIEALDQNHACLEQVLNLGLGAVDLAELEELGFDKDIITAHIHTTKTHSIYRCFDVEYAQTPTKIFHIHRVL